MPSPSAGAARANSSTWSWLVPIAAALAAVLVFRGSLAYFFGQDDFLGLARARHLAPPLSGPWRWLSGQGYFELMRGFGVASALPYHAASLIAHAAASALLAVVLARRFAPAAALAGALCFAAHPASYTALYSVSGIGEILAGLFAIATIALAERADGWRWGTLPAFALALFSKESVLLLPLALLPAPGWLAGSRAPGASRRVVIGLGALALAMATALIVTDEFGVRSRPAADAAYAVSFGPHVLANFATYLGWTVNFWLLTLRSFSDAVDPGVYPYAIAASAVWALALASPELRARGWFAMGLTFLLLLAPVLGLHNHTYHYYLYTPLIAFAWCVASVFDAWIRREPSRARPRAPAHAGNGARFGNAVALVLGALFVWNGMAVVHKVETFPFTDPRLRSDAVVDRARIALKVRDGLAAAAIPDGAPLVFWSPASIHTERLSHPGRDQMAEETYWEQNVRSALMNGLAVRVLFPRAGEISFVHDYRGAPAATRVVLYDVDGNLKVMPAGTLDSLMVAHPEDRP